MNKLYEDVKKLLHGEINAIVMKGSISPTELESLYKAVDILKDLCEIEEKETDMEEGYSGRVGYPGRVYSGGMPYRYDDRYYDIHAYRGGQNRDSMGRYSRGDAKTHMIEGLYSMMGDTDSEAEKGAIQDCINRLRA